MYKRLTGVLLIAGLVALFVFSKTEWGKQEVRGLVERVMSPRETAPTPAPTPAKPSSVTWLSKVPRLPTLRPQPTAQPQAPSPGRFMVLVKIDLPQTNRGAAWSFSPARQLVYDSKLLYRHTDYLNALFVLPRNIQILVEPCGFSNAFWDSKAEKITICDEFIEDLGTMFAEGQDAEAFRRQVMFATSFFMFHEVGHALVQEYGIAGFGRSEDTADQIAVLLLLGNDQTETIAVGAEAFMRLAISRPANVPRAFWDEHSLDEQRFFNILCWLYGSDPGRYVRLVANGMLPVDRAERCPAEYADLVKAFDRDLKPHTRNAGTPE
jgi:hypothetical protein